MPELTLPAKAAPKTLFENLIYRHKEHEKSEHWDLLWAMVSGGEAMTDDYKRKLLCNPDNRPEPIIRERLKLATYQNKLGPILNRTLSQLFEHDYVISGSTDPFWEEFSRQGALLSTDDDARCSMKGFLHQAMLQAFTEQKAIAQVDTRLATGASNRAAQRVMGEDRPYVLLHRRRSLWDWVSDDKGFVYTKLHHLRVIRKGWNTPPVYQHEFTIFQREDSGRITASRYLVRKTQQDPANPLLDVTKAAQKDVTVVADRNGNNEEIVDLEIFNYPKGTFEFPIVTLTLPPALWLADQLYDLQREHYNYRAGINWKLQTNNFSMPVILSDDDDPMAKQKTGDGYYWHFPANTQITSFNSSTAGISQAMSCLQANSQDFYETLQQIAIAAQSSPSALSRSQGSREMDARPEVLLLQTFGQYVTEFLAQIYKVAAIVRGEAVDWKIEGFRDFLDGGTVEAITEQQGIKSLRIPSQAFNQAATERFVERYGRANHFPAEVLTQSKSEIAQAPLADLIDPAPPTGQPEPESA